MVSDFLIKYRDTIFEKVEKNTFREFAENIMNGKTSLDMTKDDPIEVSIRDDIPSQILIKTDYMEEAHRLSSKYHSISKMRYKYKAGSTMPINNIPRFFNGDNIEFTRIQAQETIENSIDIIKNVYDEIGNKLFGAILIGNGSIKFNILHPIVANYFYELRKSENKTRFQKMKYDIILYTMKYTEKFDSYPHVIDEEGRKETAKDIKDLFISIHRSKKLEYSYGGMKYAPPFHVEYLEIIKDENGNELQDNGLTYIIPAQVANSNGVMYPYYGAVLINNGNRGKNMTPFLSSNIGRPGANPEAWANVCTGGIATGTDKGKKTLNHSNATSPLNTNVLSEGYLTYAEECIKASLTMLTDHNYLDEENGTKVEEEEKKVFDENSRMTLKEYREFKPESSLTDYVEYIKKRMEGKTEW
jgi:hypothetical protein